MSENQDKTEKKGYLSRLLSGISSSFGYISGGFYNIGKGVVHTAGGMVGIGPGIESGVNKISNGTGSIIDGVVQGSVESITGSTGNHSFCPEADDLLRRYSASEIRQMAKDNPQECLDIISNSFRMNSNYEDGLRFLKVVAPVVSEWPESEQVGLLNKFIEGSGMPKYAQISAVETLFDAGVSPNIGERTNLDRYLSFYDPVSPLYRVVTSPIYNPELLQLFLDNGADLSMKVVNDSGKAVSIQECVFDPKKKEIISDYMGSHQQVGLDRLNQKNITNEQSENVVQPRLNRKER